MAVTLKILGMHVPQPEVPADDTNPKGFGEPQWAVDFHTELLKRANVQVSDARPGAWFDTGRFAADDEVREQVDSWLEEQFGRGGPELVVKDPRLAWFQGLWRDAALRRGAQPYFVTMLRPVTEVVGSKQKYYQRMAHLSEVNRVAGWINVMLHIERATRGSERAFVRYDDMLSDWTVPVYQIGERFGLTAVTDTKTNNMRAVHNFIDPDLRRVNLTWDDVPVPHRIREIADGTWDALNKLADSPDEVPELYEVLDELRSQYRSLYEEAAAIAQSSAAADRRRATTRTKAAQEARFNKELEKVKRQAKMEAERAAQTARNATEANAPEANAPAEPESKSIADRIAAQLPHRARAWMPGPIRRGLKRAFTRVVGH